MSEQDQNKDSVARYIQGGFEGLIRYLLEQNIISGSVAAFLKGGAETLSEARKERMIELCKLLEEHKEIFGEHLFSDPVFMDGLKTTFEEFANQRLEKKRKIIKDIFLGYAKSQDQEGFKLERLYSTVSNISPKGIEYLAFIKRTILPIMMENIEKEASRLASPSNDFNWWMESGREHNPLSKYINGWIHENYDPNSKKVKDKYNYDGGDDKVLLQKIFDIEEIENKKYREAMAEFVSLGICRVIVEGGGGIGGGGGHIEHTLTDFGWEFVDYLSDMKEI